MISVDWKPNSNPINPFAEIGESWKIPIGGWVVNEDGRVVVFLCIGVGGVHWLLSIGLRKKT